jgi:transposase-like protein
MRCLWNDVRDLTPEFKRKAVRQMQTSGKAIAVVARELGLSRKQLYDCPPD